MATAPLLNTGVNGIGKLITTMATPAAGLITPSTPSPIPKPVPVASSTLNTPPPVTDTPSTTTDTPPATTAVPDDEIALIFNPFRNSSLYMADSVFKSGALSGAGLSRFKSASGVSDPFGGDAFKDGFSNLFPEINPRAMLRGGFTAPDTLGSGGLIGGLAGQSNYGNLDQHNDSINNAAQKMGIPPNLLKALIARESSGNWEAGTDAVWIDDPNAPGGGFNILPFVGIKEATADAWGYDWNELQNNKDLQLEAMAYGVKLLADQYGGWDNAIKVYFGGEQALAEGYEDVLGMDSNTYFNEAKKLWTELDAGAGFSGDYAGTWGNNWGNFGSDAQVYDWGEFGAESTNGLYGYGTDYGLNGTQHTGIDIMGTQGSTYTSPVSGVVTCGGTNYGSGADGGGCAAFGTMDGKNTAGRIEVQLDNGAVLIFGHSESSFVKPGQRINVGDALGTIGWANSPHIHLEARVKDPSTATGWRIVDPRTVLGGGSGGGGGSQADPSKPRWWNALKYG